MVEWLPARRRPDPRFFLREALHDPGLDFGYVLLDCPPRLTTACVAALAAAHDAGAELGTARALTYLEQALRQGYGREQAGSDPDLVTLRDNVAFQKLVAR